MRRHSAALILLALAGCKSIPEPVVVPEIVRVPVTRFVPVPDALTQPCPVTQLRDRSVASVVEAHNANKLALQQCNKQLQAIKDLGTP